MKEDKTTHHPDDEKGELNDIFGLWRDKKIDLDKLRQEQWGRFAGVISNETAEALLKYVEESRNEWESDNLFGKQEPDKNKSILCS